MEAVKGSVEQWKAEAGDWGSRDGNSGQIAEGKLCPLSEIFL